jgi:redox-sensitive bicupin YhaK (pirin superfamily)
MITRIPAESIFIDNGGWYEGRFHFSYGDYHDPENIQFGVLKAFNDFELKPNSGFDTHPHDEMEIISYCVAGELSHTDNMGNKSTIKRGDVQYLCAGSGITHTEMNERPDSFLRFIQVFFTPNGRALTPKYHAKDFSKVAQVNELNHVVSGEAKDGVIQISQDANIFIAELEKQNQLAFINQDNRQCYLVCLEGNLDANRIELGQRDALKVREENLLTLTALEDSHLMVIDIAADNKVNG